MKTISELIKNKPLYGWLLFFATMLIVFLLGLLASSVIERRAEAVFAYNANVKIDNFEPRNEVWGNSFPKQFQSYYQTSDTSFASEFGGNATKDILKEEPSLVILWAGYGFSREYKQGRGHFYAIEDIRNILRTGAPNKEREGLQPSTCWTCKSPDVPRVMAEIGIAKFYSLKWDELGSEIVNTIGCSDCHDPKTMNLRITRPALVEAFENQGKDINKASHQEMRSLVCAQCHVEYYFDKKKIEGASYLTFPWSNGTSVEQIEQYYDKIEFSDWTHALSRAPMLKAQHPDYEVFLTGIHAQRGVACADCHLPYMSEGGQKYTNHKIQSPLNNISQTCQVCHRESEETLKQNVLERQRKVSEIKIKLEQLLAIVHIEAKTAWDKGAKEEDMKPILKLIRQAQWRWDYAAAGHGNSFHSPVETSRIIFHGLDKAQEARLQLYKVLTKLGVNSVEIPDITSKEKAQKYIGLDIAKLQKEKDEFKKTVIPEWIIKAKERESKY